jgi:hypothetical protein
MSALAAAFQPAKEFRSAAVACSRKRSLLSAFEQSCPSMAPSVVDSASWASVTRESAALLAHASSAVAKELVWRSESASNAAVSAERRISSLEEVEEEETEDGSGVAVSPSAPPSTCASRRSRRTDRSAVNIPRGPGAGLAGVAGIVMRLSIASKRRSNAEMRSLHLSTAAAAAFDVCIAVSWRCSSVIKDA